MRRTGKEAAAAFIPENWQGAAKTLKHRQ